MQVILITYALHQNTSRATATKGARVQVFAPAAESSPIVAGRLSGQQVYSRFYGRRRNSVSCFTRQTSSVILATFYGCYGARVDLVALDVEFCVCTAESGGLCRVGFSGRGSVGTFSLSSVPFCVSWHLNCCCGFNLILLSCLVYHEICTCESSSPFSTIAFLFHLIP